jgi:hypothetical protein
LNGTNCVFGGTNGFANATFYLLAGTNAALPLNLWTLVATNAFGTNGNFLVTNKISAGASCQFYSLKY